MTDPKFANAGRKEGLEIWRINDFNVEVVPKEQHGSFFEGDSYIVLSTKLGNQYDVHFWLGRGTSEDEKATAALKVVDLDTVLHGQPVQYRENQNHESALFLSYFKNGIKYLSGGNATGFSHVTNAKPEPKLFQCKGKRNVRCSQVKLIKESLNLGDVFILDLGSEIYVWMPPESGRLERIKGMHHAKAIRDQERAGKAKITVLDKDWNTNTEFWKHFGGKEALHVIKSSYGGEQDEGYWQNKAAEITLYKSSDASGKLKIEKVGTGVPDAKGLDTNDAFILDAGPGGVYVWLGKQCNPNERAKAMDWARQFLEKNLRPPYTQVTRVLEGAEPASFTQWFGNWNENKKPVQHQPRLFQVSNESGKLHVEEIADFYQQDLDGDDVMVLDAFNTVYVWVGAGANKEEKEHAEATAKQFLEGGTVPRHKSATIEKLFQGKETPNFKKIFPEWDDKLFENQARSVDNVRKLLFA
uniref:Gelsolin n=1 Tax=Panagrellus redivivus TaxID=6233 RepID=A0A7E4VD24_PANRE